MKSLISILLLCSWSCGAVNMTFMKPYERAPGGIFFHETFQDSSINANWFNLGVGTASIYNSNILLVGSSPLRLTNWFIQTNWYTCGEDIKVTYRVNALITNASSGGAFFGWKVASAATTRSIWAGVYCATDSGGDLGKVMIGNNDNAGNFTVLQECPNGLLVSAFGGVFIDVTITRIQNVWSILATNPANGSYSHTNFTFDLKESGNITPTASYFGFNYLGGSNIIDDVKVELNRRIPIDILFIGKSIDDGSSATNASGRWFNRFTNDLTGWPSALNAGGFNYTSNYIRLFPEHLAYRAKYNVMMYPTDPIGGIASNLMASNVIFYVTNAQSYGMNINVAAATPNDVADYRPWNSFVSNNLPGNNVWYAGWDEMVTNNPSAYSIKAELAVEAVGSKVHLNNLGHPTQYNAMLPRRKRP